LRRHESSASGFAAIACTSGTSWPRSSAKIFRTWLAFMPGSDTSMNGSATLS
jgi:hypothetical protein